MLMIAKLVTIFTTVKLVRISKILEIVQLESLFIFDIYCLRTRWSPFAPAELSTSHQYRSSWHSTW